MIIWYREIDIDPRYNPARYRVYVEPVDGELTFRPATAEELLAKPHTNDVIALDLADTALAAAVEYAGGRICLLDPNWQARRERLEREGKLRPAPVTFRD